jgi:hypothetical protein
MIHIARAWLRWRLHRAERALDHPFNEAASLRIDALRVALEDLG